MKRYPVGCFIRYLPQYLIVDAPTGVLARVVSENERNQFGDRMFTVELQEAAPAVHVPDRAGVLGINMPALPIGAHVEVHEGQLRPHDADPDADLIDSSPSALLVDDGPVTITREAADHSISVIGRTRTITAAETFLGSSATIDPDDLDAGRYGIDAPHGLGADSEAPTVAASLGGGVGLSPEEALRFLATIEP